MSTNFDLEYIKTISDKRGSIIFMKNGIQQLNLVQIKKGFSRGGHFHEFQSTHNIISGKVKYLEFNTQTKEEKEAIYNAPCIIDVPPFVAHLFTAIEEVTFIEIFNNEYQATEFPKYRKIIEEKI